MAFGISAGLSRTTENTVEVAKQIGITGKITDMTTHGGQATVTEEAYLSGSFTNQATNGQTGTSNIVTSHKLTEQADGYAKTEITKVTALG
jgi:hypothetical protein